MRATRWCARTPASSSEVYSRTATFPAPMSCSAARWHEARRSGSESKSLPAAHVHSALSLPMPSAGSSIAATSTAAERVMVWVGCSLRLDVGALALGAALSVVAVVVGLDEVVELVGLEGLDGVSSTSAAVGEGSSSLHAESDRPSA